MEPEWPGMNLAVFGTGYVGLVTCVCFAELGHSVVAVDKDRERIARLADGSPTIFEPGLQEMLVSSLETGRLMFTTSAERAMSASEVVFLCVGTPSHSNGEADLSQVEEVVNGIAPMLDGYKLIVEKSTVPVNTAYWIDRKIRCLAAPTHDYDVASNPEFLREGQAIRDFLHPDRIVIGADSERARSLLLGLYGSDFDCPILATNVKTAELIKHASNAFLATKISFINMISDLCDGLGVDVAVVAKGMGLDPRIGSRFLNAGLGFGGSCLPKDLRAFVRIAEELGIDVSLLRDVERVNEERVDRFMRKIERALWVVGGKTVGVLGGAFKPDTSDIRGAPGLKALARLKEAGAVLRVYDPKAAGNLVKIYPPDGRLDYVDSPYDAATGAHALVILTEWAEFQSMDLARVRSLMRTPIIIDGRNLFDPAEMRRKGFEYHSLGRGDVTMRDPHPGTLAAGD